MDETELQSIIASEIEDAVSFIDTDIGPDRAETVDYYFGRPFGDEEDGRSQVISRDVHDTIQAIEPSLMRIFFSPEHVVEFAPHGPDDEPTAEQATDYINYVFTRDNDGFAILQTLFRNALREKTGIAKYWWDSSVEVTTVHYTGLDETSLAKLMEDLDQALEAEIVDSSEDEHGLSVELKLKRRTDKALVAAIPPEEFLISRRAKSIAEASFVGHRSMKTVSELVAMGYEREEVEEHSGDGDELARSDERLARRPNRNGADTGVSGNQGDDSQRLVLYVEGYQLVDFDDDGIAELRKVCCMGPNYTVVHNEPASYRPFADFHCDPEPHAFFGSCTGDDTKDIQRIKSMVWRASLDSLAQSIYPRTVVVENDGHMEDALNPEVGAVLRAKSPQGYVTLTTPFVGEQAFPMLTYMDSVRENRTGMSKVSMGLDAESLQNTTATAAEGQFSRSQDRIDLIARTLSNGLRKLYSGLLRLVVENQRKERVIQLSGKWVPVDPRVWRVDMDVVCNVGLGGGSDAAKAQILGAIAEKQEQVLMTMGPDNPLVGLEEYRTTLVKGLELGGFRNPTAFFKELPKDEQGYVQLPQQEPKPDPEMAKVQGQQQLAEMQAKHSFELRQMEIAANERVSMTKAQRECDLAQAKQDFLLNLKREQVSVELELSAQQAEAELEMDAQSQDIEPGGEPG